MALRNAFDMLATEGKQDSIIAAIQALDVNSDDVETTLSSIQTLLEGTLTVSGTVATTGTQTDGLTDAELRATPVPVSGTVTAAGTQTDALTDTELRAAEVPVSDDYTGGEVLPDQTGSGSALTFTFTDPVKLVVVQPSEDGCRADPFGGTPSDTTGIPLVTDVPNFIPVTTSAVKVYAPAGADVTVWGFTRA